MLYLVSFDLKRPGQRYKKIKRKLNRVGKKVLRTQWLIHSEKNAQDLLSHFKLNLKIFDSNDRVLILNSPESRSGAILGVACQNLLSNVNRSDFF